MQILHHFNGGGEMNPDINKRIVKINSLKLTAHDSDLLFLKRSIVFRCHYSAEHTAKRTPLFLKHEIDEFQGCTDMQGRAANGICN